MFEIIKIHMFSLVVNCPHSIFKAYQTRSKDKKGKDL